MKKRTLSPSRKYVLGAGICFGVLCICYLAGLIIYLTDASGTSGKGFYFISSFVRRRFDSFLSLLGNYIKMMLCAQLVVMGLLCCACFLEKHVLLVLALCANIALFIYIPNDALYKLIYSDIAIMFVYKWPLYIGAFLIIIAYILLALSLLFFANKPKMHFLPLWFFLIAFVLLDIFLYSHWNTSIEGINRVYTIIFDIIYCTGVALLCKWNRLNPFTLKLYPLKPASPALGNADTLHILKDLLDAGAITPEEFEAKKAQILNL